MYKIQQVSALHDSVTGVLTGLMGADNKEYMLPVVTVNGTLVSADGSYIANLTNPFYGAVGDANNYIQTYIWNKNTGVNASADFIAYPDNGVDTSGWMDMGITSSNFAQAAYSVTGPNEGYLFMSGKAAAGKSGDMVLATDATGTSNSIRFYVNSFAKAIGAWSAKITGANGLFSFASGFALTGKVFPNNGATTTYTYPANTSYAYITTTAATLAFTLPTVTGAAGALLDGSVIEIVTNIGVAVVTWASTGGSFVGAPTATAANVPVKMIYHHATLSWYPA